MMHSTLYNDLARKTYSKEQFSNTVGQMLPMLIGHFTEPENPVPPELMRMLVEGLQSEYLQALKIHSECLAATYTEPQAAVLLAFYEDNPWVLVKNTEFAMMSIQRMMSEFAPNLAERIIEEYESKVNAAQQASQEIDEFEPLY